MRREQAGSSRSTRKDDRLASAAPRRFGAEPSFEDLMTAAHGKSCGECTMCCSAFEINELKKPAGPACVHCGSGGCAIYSTRLRLCRDFECEWLTSRTLPPHFRPDRIGTILMEAHDADEYRAVCQDPRPLARRKPRVFAHLVAVAKTGRIVVAKSGMASWRMSASGESGPTI